MKIIIKKQEWSKLLYFVERARGEVGGFGFADKDDDGNIVIDKILLTKQTATAAHVDHDDEGLNEFALKHADNIERIRLQWHSHGDLGAFFSTTDDDNIDGLMKSGIPWLASIVITKKLETEARVDINEPFRVSVADVEIEIENEGIEPEPDWKEEYDENVTEPKETTHSLPALNEKGSSSHFPPGFGDYNHPYNPMDDDDDQPYHQTSMLDGKTCASCFREIEGIKFWDRGVGAYVCDSCHQAGRKPSPDASKLSATRCEACEAEYTLDEIPNERKDLDGKNALICNRCADEWDEVIAEEQADDIDEAIAELDAKVGKPSKAEPAV